MVIPGFHTFGMIGSPGRTTAPDTDIAGSVPVER